MKYFQSRPSTILIPLSPVISQGISIHTFGENERMFPLTFQSWAMFTGRGRRETFLVPANGFLGTDHPSSGHIDRQP